MIILLNYNKFFINIIYMDTVYFYILLILLLIGYLYYKKTENLKNIPKDKKISHMLFPNCNFLEGDQGETCNKTKGCFYNNGCYFEWNDII